KNRLIRLIPYLLLIILILVLNYILLPALTLQDPMFRVFIGFIFVAILIIELGIDIGVDMRKKVSRVKYGLIFLPIIFVGLTFVIQFFNGPMFRATDYAAL